VSTSTITAIIPARSGSKGLPQKNVKRLGNRSLVEIAIDCALESNSVENIVVTSDSDEILKQAIQRGVIAHKRPSNLAADGSPMVNVIANVIASNLVSTDYAVLLQPTSPLRRSDMILDSFDLLKSTNADAVYSMQELDKRLLKSWVVDPISGSLNPITTRFSPFANRQGLSQPFLCDGLIYLFSVMAFIESGSLPIDNVQRITFDKNLAVDIDTIEDFESVRQHFQDGS